MTASSNGQKCTFLQLLDSYERIVIPKIQRDYAQGREDPAESSLCREVRENFVRSIQTALVDDSPLVLDYIYGSEDEAKIFYPIDGQQRLTTLFLLHWYIAMKENKLTDEVKTALRKFSYEIRDTSKEFCRALVDMSFDDLVNVPSIKAKIVDSAGYYTAYHEDPTVQAMMVMLEEIHKELKDKDALWDRLKNITFWVLSLERFGLTDDLFVKMNARGKRLSGFDVFKSELEAALDQRIKKEPNNDRLKKLTDIWKRKIDNEYLDAMWQAYGKQYAERNIYRTILFFVNCCLAMQKTDEWEWEISDKNAPYKQIIAALASDTTILENVCSILGKFKFWKDTDDKFGELLIKKDDSQSLPYYVRVRLYGILYWWATVEDGDAACRFADFYRILCNYIAQNREYAISTRRYNSGIDARTVGKRLKFIKELIDGYRDAKGDFYAYIRSSSATELAFEREKLNYGNLQEIIALENCAVLKRSIQNLFFEGQIQIQAKEMEEITASDNLKNMALRIILSFSDPMAGEFRTLVFDDTTKQSWWRRLYYEDENDVTTGYCHRYFIKPSADDSFGDKVFTADGNTDTARALSDAVKKFARAFYNTFYGQNKTVFDAMQEILGERLNEADFSDTNNILWYIVTYPEFFYTPSSTTFLVKRKKHYDGTPDEDNIYDIRCTEESISLYSEHYNPFYLAVKRRLQDEKSGITIPDGSVRFTGNQIEYLHPCLLSNGWRIRILKNGKWGIQFNGTKPNEDIVRKYQITGDEFELQNQGEYCIELITQFILACNGS